MDAAFSRACCALRAPGIVADTIDGAAVNCNAAEEPASGEGTVITSARMGTTAANFSRYRARFSMT